MIRTVVTSLAILSGVTLVKSHAVTLRQKCINEIRKVERDKGIEPGLLEAIAHVESKMNPYVVNACGQAFHFSSAKEVAQFVKKKQEEGYRNISVGPMQLHVPSHRRNFKSLEQMCEIEHNVAYSAKLFKRLKKKQEEGYRNISVGPMQLHVPSHRRNFKSLEQMCEIEHNVAYSAKLFKRLRKKTGSNEGAVKLYHSPDSYANEPYKARVFGAWAKIKVKRKQQETVPVKATKTCKIQ